MTGQRVSFCEVDRPVDYELANWRGRGTTLALSEEQMILVVDDDQMFLEKAQKILNRERQVFLASSSKKAYTLAQDLGFSVVLVDLDLRGDDGQHLIRRIRQNIPGLPIIGITEQTQQTAGDLVRELGVAEVLQKPITPEWKPVVERVRAMRVRP